MLEWYVVWAFSHVIGQDAVGGLESVLSVHMVYELVRRVLLRCSDACRMGMPVRVLLAPATQEIPEICTSCEAMLVPTHLWGQPVHRLQERRAAVTSRQALHECARAEHGAHMVLEDYKMGFRSVASGMDHVLTILQSRTALSHICYVLAWLVFPRGDVSGQPVRVP